MGEFGLKVQLLSLKQNKNKKWENPGSFLESGLNPITNENPQAMPATL